MKDHINVTNGKNHKPKTQNFRVSRQLGNRVKMLGVGISGTTKLFESILDTLDEYPDVKKKIMERQLKDE